MASNEVEANLEQFLKDLGPVYIRKALIEACGIIRDQAVRNAPKRTGTLSRSIDFEVDSDGTTGFVFSDANYAP